MKELKEKLGTHGSRPKKFFAGRVGEWLNQQTVNLPLLAGYEGSNPSPSTRLVVGQLPGIAGKSQQRMFGSGLIRGECAAQEKCAAKESVSRME